MARGRVSRSTTKAIYQRIAKPLLFRQHPDRAHDGMIRTARMTRGVGMARVLNILRFSDTRLEQDLLGLQFANPIGLSAGLDKNFDLPEVMKCVGAGFMTGGSTTAEICVGNPRPWFHRLPEEKSIVVHVGLANNGVVSNIKKIASYPTKIWQHFPLIVSVAKTNNPENSDDVAAIRDYCESLRQLEDANAAPLYEVNISCPNTYGGEPFTTPERLEKLLASIDELQLTRPVLVKMPTDKTDEEFLALLAAIDRHGVAGLTIGNLMKDRRALKRPEKLDENIQGGLSGAPDRTRTTELVRLAYGAYRSRFVIIGVGGVFTAEDAYEKIRAGASLVGLVTALMFEGPQVIGDINAGLVSLLEADGFHSIAEAVGADEK